MALLASEMKTYVLGTVGALMSILGVTFFFIWPPVFESLLHKQMQVTSGSHTFRLWKDTPIPMQMSFYLFNWTNYENIKHEKPKLEQIGPYRFKLEERKTNITMNCNGTVTFQIQRLWYFDAENSNGTLDDYVTTLNAVAMSAAFTVRDWSEFMKLSFGFGVVRVNTKLHVTEKVGEILFDGYSDPLIDIAMSLPNMMGVNIPYDKFGWFYKRNGTSDSEGVFNMDTGENNIYNLGKLHNWNYKPTTDFYPDGCGMVNGSAGELFPPKQTKDKKLQFYSPDLCRSVSLSFKEEVEVHGIKGYKYTGDEYTFDNGTLDPSNECFCEGECIPSGVLNVTKCRYGAPGYVSFPHFFLADESYINAVEGLKPDPEKHTLYITLEPETGIPLDVSARFQVNIQLSPYDYLNIMKDVPSIVFPMLWFEHTATITPNLAFLVKLALYAPMIGVTCFLLMALGGLFLLGYTIYLAFKGRRRMHRKVQTEMKGISLVQNSCEQPFLLKRKASDVPKVISTKTTLIN
ncbi:protein croquemort-like isoform X2 [Cimex lectularius]|nr:protein croquemort-like isoform X2 [Cimex lectularius]XP_024086103.1 protein croquemort-like isoform X2 [Cimex lectularius]XP_024086104.1 protein croquemort-like isoform X2 [Cimex lectularius]XP_024086105.1 protein croquemort-like isoform X2 [Cimex lectularius]